MQARLKIALAGNNKKPSGNIHLMSQVIYARAHPLAVAILYSLVGVSEQVSHQGSISRGMTTVGNDLRFNFPPLRRLRALKCIYPDFSLCSTVMAYKFPQYCLNWFARIASGNISALEREGHLQVVIAPCNQLDSHRFCTLSVR